MDKVLRLFTYVDGGINDTPFPDSDNPIEIGEFRYDAKRMGGAPTITASVNYPTCLDDVWTDMVYTELNGERYFLKQTPTSSKGSDDARYKHDLIFVAERVILDNAYFFDAVVGDPLENDKPVTNSTKFHFYGNIEDFVRRMNSSLQYTNLQKVDEEGNVISGYYVVLDDDVAKREDKLVSFDDAVFSQALQEAYNTFGVPFYFNGKEIHVGYSTNIIEDVLEYGVDGALLSATRTNANFKVVNRATGEGSSDNIPYYYPNASSKGEISCEVNSVNPLSVVIVDAEEYANGIGIDETIEFVGAEYTIGNAEYYLPSPMRWDKYTPSNDVYLHFRNVGSKSSVKFRRKITTSGATSIEFYPTVTWVKMQYNDGSIVDDFEQEKVQKHISLNVYKTGEKAFFTVDDIGVGGTTIEIPEAGEFCVETTVKAVNPFSLKNFSYIDFYVSYEDVVIGNAGWHIGNKRVYLDEIGLSVSGNVTNGDTITQRIGKNISSSSALQPSIYRATDGKERFYNAINYPFAYEEGYELKYGEYILDGQVHNDVYKKDDGTYYEFTNEYKEGRPREHVFSVDDIKPTIKEMTNNISWVEQDEEGNNKTVFQRIDMFSEFAYNIGDNDETYTDPDGNTSFRHPYFFGKLRRLDFNLFECASEIGEMTFSMTSGHCGACNFKLGVDEDGQFNPVQVDEKGNLIYDDRGYVLCGLEDFQGEVEAQDRQQDTINNEVWIALKKEDDTYGILMPKAPKYDEQGNLVDSGHRPVACSSENANDGDTFVILNINLPEEYILHAEKKLEKAIVKYIWENNAEKFNFSVNFSRIFLEENPNIANAINENARLTRVKYNGDEYVLYVSSYSYTMNEGDVLPEIRIELDDTLTIAQNALQNAINEVKSDIASAINAIDVAAIGSRYFLRKDTFDTAEAPINFKGGIFFGEGGDVSYYEDGSAKLTIDYLEVTKKATFTSLEIQEKTHAGGQILLTPAAMVCSRVEETSDAYRCYFQNEGEEGKVIFNQFAEGDQAISQTFNEWGGHYYWRLVTAVGEDYVDLSKTDCAPESDSPSVGDKIIQLGNRDDATRQNAIVIAAYGDSSPYIIQYKRINAFELTDDKIVTKLSSTENIFTGKVHMELGSDGFENIYGEVNLGGSNMLRNSGFTGMYLSEALADESVLEATKELYNNPLIYWELESNDLAEVVSMPNDSASGYGLQISHNPYNESIYQTLYNSVIANEDYVFSFKAKANSGQSFVRVFCGDTSNEVIISDTWQRYSVKFSTSLTSKTIGIIADDCLLCELQLERGTVATAWNPSYLDNSSDRAYYESLKYLDIALGGATDVLGGLVLTNSIRVGNHSNNTDFVEYGGINGSYVDENSPAFWAGGDFDKALDTTTGIAEEEIPFVVSHSGKIVANDAIIRGTIYAQDGEFSGKVNATEGNFGEGCTIGTLELDSRGIYLNGCASGGGYSITLNPEKFYMARVKDEGGLCSIIRYIEIDNSDNRSAYLTIDEDIADAIRINRGGVSGLRTSSCYISSVPNDGSNYLLNSLHHNILFPKTGTYPIKLPENPENGQEFWFETMGADIDVTSIIPMWSHTNGAYETSHKFASRGVIRFKYYGGLIPTGSETLTTGVWTYTWVESR